MEPIEVTAVIPVFNDRTALSRAIPASLAALNAITAKYELVIAEDGSHDGSADFVREYTRKDEHVRLAHSDERLGRGRALTRVLQEGGGPIICYYDVDLATDMSHLPELIQSIREGYDIATGSRLLPGSMVVRSGKRELPSRVYNWLVRQILGSTLHDHQCGFKAFRRDTVLSILPSVRARHWFWDTELLVRSQRKGLNVREFPVQWTEGKGTTVRLKDILSMGSSILHLWWQLHVAKN